VWSWNAALALVAGDPVIWKPSDKTPLTALACDALLARAAADVGAPPGLNQVLQGGADVGAALAAHDGVAIVSATGSTRMGRAVAPVVASRFGRLILELGGNNAAIVAMPAQTDIVRTETFGPLLYVLGYDDLDEAIAIHNDVPQGLASSIFTNDVREAERFMAADGSDCGIVNVNIGTSGAEIGGAIGGEKETGGGRESGSDAWRAYMRRATNTVNYSGELPLAQGVDFTV
jgi:acyl-CoA reductase-like NAD-dependent aldehyde dehydrogenase